jgi:hypothetical protein
MKTLKFLVCLVVAIVSLRASAAEEERATVVDVVGNRAALDIGTKAGIKEGAVFRLYSPTRIVRIPLTDTVTMQSGEPVATLVADEVRADRAWGEVTLFGEGVQLRKGMDAILIGQRSLQSVGSLSVEVEANVATPGDWVAIKVKGAPDGTNFEWKTTAGWLSASEGMNPVVQWVAPATPGKADISVRAVTPTGEEYKAAVNMTVKDGAYDASGKPQQHVITGRLLSSNGEPRVSDVCVTSDGVYYTDIRSMGLYKLAGSMGVSEIIGPNRGKKLLGPYDLAISGGKAYVLDNDFYPLKKYDLATGEMEGILGKEAKMQNPADLAVGKNGLIYVLDRDARCIHIIENSGTFRLSFGKKGANKGEFLDPVAISLDGDGNIIVLDAKRKMVIIYDSAMGLKEEWGLQLRGKNAAKDIAASANGDVWVLEGPQVDVVKYKSGGKVALRADGGVFANLPPEALKLSADAAGNVYIIPENRAGIFRFSPDGAYTGGAALSGVRSPAGLAVAPNGAFAINHFEPPFVDVYDSAGWNIGSWGSPFNEPVRFNLPGRLAYRSDGRAIYALGGSEIGAFAMAKRTFFIYMFAPEGKLMEFFGGQGDAYGRYKTMNDCDIDAAGGFWVLDNEAMRVTVYGEDRNMPTVKNLVKGKTNKDVAEPVLLTTSPDGKSFYVYDVRLRAVKHFDSNGAFINMMDVTTLRPAVEDIVRIKAGPFGQVYILDRARSLVHVVDFKGQPTEKAILSVDQLDSRLADLGVDGASRVIVVSEKGTVYALSKR